jgi:hypothetical protein
MMTTAQAVYLKEVLGVSLSPVASPPPAHIVVWTHSADQEFNGLLHKILSAIRLGPQDYLHIQGQELRAAELPEGLAAKHILAFRGVTGPEHHSVANTQWWSLPRLSEMAASSLTMHDSKRKAWATLQHFSKEFSP